MSEMGNPYVGVIYAGLMITKSGPKVLEFNCRFGDPETQAILPLMKTDLIDLIMAAVDGSLNSYEIEWLDSVSCVVVIASGGYPGAFTKNLPITGIADLDDQCLVFHAGTRINEEGFLVNSGGRVLNIVALGKDMREAREIVYRNVSKIKFENSHYRKDIGLSELI